MSQTLQDISYLKKYKHKVHNILNSLQKDLKMHSMYLPPLLPQL